MSSSRYTKLVNTCTVDIPCSVCDGLILPKAMALHLKRKHPEVYTRRTCLWCLEYIWKDPSVKCVDLHRRQCLRSTRDAIRKMMRNTRKLLTPDTDDYILTKDPRKNISPQIKE